MLNSTFQRWRSRCPHARWSHHVKEDERSPKHELFLAKTAFGLRMKTLSVFCFQYDNLWPTASLISYLAWVLPARIWKMYYLWEELRPYSTRMGCGCISPGVQRPFDCWCAAIYLASPWVGFYFKFLSWSSTTNLYYRSRTGFCWPTIFCCLFHREQRTRALKDFCSCCLVWRLEKTRRKSLYFRGTPSLT